jgi:DNA-binding NtrC family response regulator
VGQAPKTRFEKSRAQTRAAAFFLPDARLWVQSASPALREDRHWISPPLRIQLSTVVKHVHKILLVDDEVATRDMYQLFLERNGYAVITASSVSEALHILARDRICLALIDVFLNGDNGLELLKGIKAARPEFPVVMMSGLGLDESLGHEALAGGALAFFPKALPLEPLLHHVKQAIPRCASKSARLSRVSA